MRTAYNDNFSYETSNLSGFNADEKCSTLTALQQFWSSLRTPIRDRYDPNAINLLDSFVEFLIDQLRRDIQDNNGSTNPTLFCAQVSSLNLTEDGLLIVPPIEFLNALTDSNLNNESDTHNNASRQQTKDISSKPIESSQTPSDLIASAQQSTMNFENRRTSGESYAYTVRPLELAQRLSTSARNANSLELALSAAASMQGSGIGADLGVGYLRAAVGNIEALERTPIVVGFADRKSFIEFDLQPGESKVIPPESDDQLPQVGWVFAPPTRTDAERGRLDYVHIPTAFDVSADLSVPGWWPYTNATLETAWVGNWNSVGQPIRIDEQGEGYHSETFRVRLPTNKSDLDSLTNVLSTQTIGQTVQQASITEYSPRMISACSSSVEFIIRGANVWRSTEVFLGGQRAEDIRVLPDMEGVIATFNVGDFFEIPNTNRIYGEQYIELSVQTRNGPTRTVDVEINGRRIESSSSSKSICEATQNFSGENRSIGDLTIENISPQNFSACVNTISIAFSTNYGVSSNLSAQVFLNGVKGEIQSIGDNNPRNFIATISNPIPRNYSQNKVELTFVTENGIASESLSVSRCTVQNQETTRSQLSFATNLATYTTASNEFEMELGLRVRNSARLPTNSSIAIRPDVPNFTDPLVQSVGPIIFPTQSGENHKVRFSVILADHPQLQQNLGNGRRIKAVLLDINPQNLTTTSVPVEGNIVIYEVGAERAEVGKIKQSISYDDFNIEIDLPINHAIAYPGLSSSSLRISSNNEDFQFSAVKVPNSPGNNDSLTFKITHSFDALADGEQNAEDLSTYLLDSANSIQLTPEFIATNNQSVPEIIFKINDDISEYLTLGQ
ncbi:MAG: hypothetical protein GKR91_08580 [Pseudomonadales bacterium]|nr:hypothetical protein [Pseudomonadales bacterium]